MLDAVITYVDSRDENWKREYNMFVKRPLEEVENRFRSYDCLDLQIKLIRKNMKFVDNVYVIVSSTSQVPDNVKNMDGVKIVTHKEIIPKRYLPCFNSCTIEMYMYNIKELKENFIYFNDDMFVVSKCEETDFIKNGKFIIDYEYKDFDPEFATPFEMNVINANRLVDKSATTFIKPAHFCMPLNKNHITEVWVMHKNEIEKSMTRTRHRNNINFYTFIDYEIVNKNAVWKEIPSKYFTTLDNLELQYQDIIEKKAKFICVNDSGLYDDSFIEEFRLMLECLLTKRKFVESKQEIEIKKLIGDSKIVVTMTSWKNRIFLVNNVIKNMLSQTLEPNKIVLNLSINEFPNQELSLPKDLVKTIHENSNICEIYWVKENYKQFKKLVHTLDRFPNDIIISIDDDFPYPSNFVETLYNDYIDNKRQNPISYSDFIDKDGFHNHYGAFTITESKFYKKYLHKILDEFIYPNFRKYKCYDDPVYTEVAKLNGYEYKEGSVNYNKIALATRSETIDAISKRTAIYTNKRNEFIDALKSFIESLSNSIKEISKLDEKYEFGISICVSAYKSKKYIKETLLSIKNQTWFKFHNNWECNIGIDGCKETLDYVKLIMNEFDLNHFHFYYMPENKGTYVTSNTLMSKISKYSWCLRFDSDDIMRQNMIETIINNIDEKTDIFRFNLRNFADAEYTLNDTEKTKKTYISYGQICVKHLKFDRYGGYLPWKCSADAEFLARTRRFLKQKKLQDILFDRRITNESLTNSKNTDNKSEIRKQYAEYINTISINVKNRNNAINKNIEINSYVKVLPYELIISLTSFPQRILFVKSVLESIVNTSIDKDLYKLILVLSIEEFPNKENDLPIDLVSYCSENNIEILWTYRNIRSHKKLIPTIKKYSSLPILVIDDDIIRNEEWLRMFINDHRKYPQDILCMRCDDYITTEFECIHDRNNFENGVKFENYIYHNRPSNGCGGLLYPANTFRDINFYNDDLFMNLSPSSDEMWQYCFNVMNNQKIRRTSMFFDFDSIKGTQKVSLYKENKGKYTEIMKTLLNWFPLYKDNLIKLFNEEHKINNESYKAIVSLTSWKKRISTVYKTITNLLTLAKYEYKIVLTLSIEEFPNKEKDLPNELTALLGYDNFEINWIYKNYKVFKKILFTMQKYQNLPIISADDDIIYKYNYLDELYDIWMKNKDCVISEGYEIKYTINNEVYKFSKGCATLYPPGCLLNATKYLNDEILNTQNDDSFYGIYFHLNNIKIINVHNNIKNLITEHTNNDAITINVKTQEDFYNDKLIILDNIKKYKEV